MTGVRASKKEFKNATRADCKKVVELHKVPAYRRKPCEDINRLSERVSPDVKTRRHVHHTEIE